MSHQPIFYRKQVWVQIDRGDLRGIFSIQRVSGLSSHLLVDRELVHVAKAGELLHDEGLDEGRLVLDHEGN